MNAVQTLNGVATHPLYGADINQNTHPTEKEIAQEEPDKRWAFWLREIKSGVKIEERWRREGDLAEARYYGEERELLSRRVVGDAIDDKTYLAHSTVDTMRPVIYSQPPSAIVRRRFGGAGEDDPVDKVAAEVVQRLLSYLIERTDFDYTMGKARDDWMIPGRGHCRVLYDAEIVEEEVQDPISGAIDVQQVVRSEQVYAAYWPWRDIVLSPATSEQTRRWCAYRHYMGRDEATRRFGEEIAAQLSYTVAPQDDEGSNQPEANQWQDSDEEGQPDSADTRPRAVIWEIWIREGRKVLWLSATYQNGLLKEEEDPLQFEDFWDFPKPLLATVKGETSVPRPDMVYWAPHLDAIDLANKKLNGVLRALQVVGFYPGNSQELLNTALEGDKTKPKLIAIPDLAAFVEQGGMSTFVQWFPIEQFVAAAQQFMVLIEAKKQQLFEGSGVSDVMRGASDPTETATAQRIKGRYGGLRVSEKQRRMGLFCRDTLRMMAEAAVEHFDETTVAAITQIDLPWTEEERALRSMIVPGPDGQPQPVDPSFKDQGASWETVMQLLRSDLLRKYAISIETDSTIIEDEQEDREARVQFLTAFAGFAETLAPMVQGGLLDMASVKALLLFGIRGFRKARMLEYMIEDLPEEAPQQGPSEADLKVQLEQIKGGIEKELQAAKLAHDASEGERDRRHDLRLKGVDLKAEAARDLTERERETERDEREEGRRGRDDARADIQRREEREERFSERRLAA